MKKTLLVDGQFLLKASFHGNTTMYDKYFGYIGCTFTFLTIIRKIIKEQNITKVLIFWDGISGGKLRHDIYPYYKANRKHKSWYDGELILSEKEILREENSDKSILQQRERIKQYCEELFFRQIEDPICEADDCIAYYVNNLLEKDELAIIYTNDRDFCQLLSDNVHIYLQNLKKIINPNNYWQHFNHELSNSALIKAICGCNSDNVFGIEGLAEKGLLKIFPELRTHKCSIDHILIRAKEINEGRTKPLKPLQSLQNLIDGVTSVKIDNIFNGRHLLELNYKLVNLNEPFLTEECIEQIELNSQAPIDPEGRGGKEIMRLMFEDGIIKQIIGGSEGYINFLKEFIPVVKAEKQIYQNYLNS